ncbi:MAG TPA: hypothetical protein VK209_09540 [Candidatus Sulfotelmatobacter sp.]|jgi:hypothetical protein|nr:hypothetical protein [Candidatus Sulfotelmatobacter sp.]
MVNLTLTNHEYLFAVIFRLSAAIFFVARAKRYRRMDSLDIKLYCRRRILLSNIEIIDGVLRFYEESEKRKESRNFY